ncbi:hypothetical protein DFS34DRAFT_686321 [Phlyctochytrium arcticum]|nr:hypothetical protein DFS34DRAFT_686321 [Phlyctochytrium arcticum]
MPVQLQLPTEIIAQIVEHLFPKNFIRNDRLHYPTLWAVCLVSRMWKDVAQPLLWAEAGMLYYHRRVEQLEAFYTALVANPQLGRFIKILIYDVGDEALVSLKILRAVARHCPNLQELEVTKSPLSNEDFCELAKNCDKLVELRLDTCPNITTDGWIGAAPFLRQLRRLQLYQFPDFGDMDVRAIVDSCPLMQSVELKKTDVTPDEISYFMLNAPNLVELVAGFEEHTERRRFEDILHKRPVRLKTLYVWTVTDQLYNNGEWFQW